MVSACVDFVEKPVKKIVVKNVKHVKMKKDTGYGEMCCSRQRFKMTAQKRHLSGRRHFSVVAFLLLKKRRIDGFGPVLSPNKYEMCANKSCDVATSASSFLVTA